MRPLLFLLMILAGLKASGHLQSITCKVIHPERLITDYKPDESDMNTWFEENIYSRKVSQEQRDYLLRKLRFNNRGAAFLDPEAYTATMKDEWKGITVQVRRWFKNKKYGKGWLALIVVEYGQWMSDHRGKTDLRLVPESDEFFIAPIDALECYWYYDKSLTKSEARNNEVPQIHIMASRRPFKNDQRYLNMANLKIREISSFSPAALENLHQALGNDDLFAEIKEMSSPENIHGYRPNSDSYVLLYKDASAYWSMYKLTAFSVAEFRDESGKAYEVIQIPFEENDDVFKNNKELLLYRGSTNWRDCYYIAELGTAGDIPFGDNMSYVLARAIRQCKTGFRAWLRPLSGRYTVLHGFGGLGTFTTNDYRLPLISDNEKVYYFSDGILENESDAEGAFTRARNILDTLKIFKYGTLQKGGLSEPKTNSGGITTTLQQYTIRTDNLDFGVFAYKIKFRDNFFLAGIMIVSPY